MIRTNLIREVVIKNITLPDIGSEADVIEILVKPGDTLTPETSVVTLESDKATMEVPAGQAGIVKEVKVKVGDKVSTGAILLIIEGEIAQKEKPKEKPLPPKEVKEVKEVKEIIELDNSGPTTHAGPAVRRLAREFGVDLTQLQGTGFKNRILKEDVQAYVKGKLSGTASSLAPTMPVIDFKQFGDIDIQALSRIKKIAGKNLHRNWISIPHVTQFAESDITDLESYRQKHKARFEKEGLKLTPLVFIMKAVVDALRKFPSFNASLDPQGENLILKKYFHIGVAVDTPDGLVVPVIRDVNKKRMTVLAKELAQVSEKARNKQLMPADMQGGCFSISSLGGIGGTAFTPIVNAPEVAILGVSKAAYKPLYQEGNFVPRLMLPLSLSYDHRVIDGAEAARFVVYLSELLSDIRHLLL